MLHFLFGLFIIKKRDSALFDNSLLNVNNINYTINNKKILENISFKIYEKDVLCIIGPNGSGKSTLIKILTQEIEP